MDAQSFNKSAFDRWANSTAIEEFFDSDIELCNYLHEQQLYIYKDLVGYLSREYDDVAEEYQSEYITLKGTYEYYGTDSGK